MEFSKTEAANLLFHVVFNKCETEVVIAAFREQVYRKTIKGNSGSLGEFELEMAARDDMHVAYNMGSENSTVPALRAFHEATDEAITAIPDQTSLPPYANPHIARRHAFGQRALKIAE